MKISPKKQKILISFAVVVILLAVLRIHVLRVDSGGTLFWNAEDAYLFINARDAGYRFSYLGYAVEVVREIYPFGASSPEENHFSLLVLHVTRNSVERYTTDNFWLGSGPYPFHGELDGGYHDGKFLVWSGTRFEPTPPPTAKADDSYWKATAGPNYNNVEGWSKRTIGGEVVRESPTLYVEKDSRVTIQVAGQNLTFIMNSGFISHHAYVDLIRLGQPRERIWQQDESPHVVSGATYDRIFAGELGKELVQGTNSSLP